MWGIISIFIFTTLVAIFPIIFEDFLKKSNIKEPIGKIIKVAFKKLNHLKRGFIILIILLNAVSCVISINNLNDNKRKQEAIEFEKENIFMHMQNEVQDNLQKLLYLFKKEYITQMADSNLFTSSKLSDLYILKYGTISEQKIIMGWLTQTSDAIIGVNNLVDDFVKYPSLNPRDKKTAIKLFQLGVENAKKYLYPIYYRVYKLNSYKEYESIDFTDTVPKFNLNELNYSIYQSVWNRPDADTIPPKY